MDSSSFIKANLRFYRQDLDTIPQVLFLDFPFKIQSYGNLIKKYTVEREKFPTYYKLTHHITKSTKYSQLQSTAYCYQIFLSLLRSQRKFAKCHAKTNHTSAHVSDDTSNLTRVSDDTSSLAPISDDTNGVAHVTNDIGGPIKL